MKKTAYFFLAVLCLFLAVSCSGGENVAGKWKTEQFSEELDGTVIIVYDFSSDGKVSFSPLNSENILYSIPLGTYTVEGNKLVINSDDGAKTEYEFTVSDDTLKLVTEGTEITMQRYQ